MFLSTPAATAQPLLEMERFFPAPRTRDRATSDAQARAVERLVRACARVRPHLSTVQALERFIVQRTDPALVRRRISLALALEEPGAEVVYGRLGKKELAMFRALARRKPAAVIWVFS
jgi:hypothetical protein